ncbi:hypothetical protein [Chitinolyticbacter meiyuanensis]|uniref:hypothetical protein n=1 Tax=Chitinolyticbacter meiyuanensis TaxID=682798 RepID=UPI0011E5D64A|nr:hypothetical protein [Chitinolyticbacter meiyuanensis]
MLTFFVVAALFQPSFVAGLGKAALNILNRGGGTRISYCFKEAPPKELLSVMGPCNCTKPLYVTLDLGDKVNISLTSELLSDRAFGVTEFSTESVSSRSVVRNGKLDKSFTPLFPGGELIDRSFAAVYSSCLLNVVKNPFGPDQAPAAQR